ncbi:phosphate acetyltransferase [Phragmitibacter flavus]|uniref:Phosphate acetyltransferase n=1 Tax=Phragmitibacter flavus TaxID=2576071 RepID=A0A5R8KHW0_9BACT|nr:phosphate acetyltransferase [Phragmitibacter flavus]TLD71821.1 phosphate acetyltransferase [Phragmitibacter flavus]
MPHTLYLTPSGSGAGLTSLALGLVRALDKRGVRVAFCKPIGQPEGGDLGPERSTHFVRQATSLKPASPIPLEQAERLISSGRVDELLERVVGIYHQSAADADVVIVEGLVHTPDDPHADDLNLQLAKTLSAEIILAGSLGSLTLDEFEARLEYAAKPFGGIDGTAVIGCIINRVPNANNKPFATLVDELRAHSRFIGSPGFHLIGAVPENTEISSCRTIDVARYLNATTLFEGEMKTRRVKKFNLLARTVPNMLNAFVPGNLLITPSDRSDVIVAACLASLNDINLAGLLLTGETEVPPGIFDLCRPAIETGLPILHVESNSWHTATDIAKMSHEVPADDLERVELSMDFVASYIDSAWIATHAAIPIEARLSPAAFCFKLTELARAADKRIVLPEGNEPRTIRAAALCAQRGIARCVLIGNPEEIHRVAKGQQIELPANIEILDPTHIRQHYVSPLVEMRKHKGLTPEAAADLLDDHVWLGTVMLALGEVDGLVSGAVHSTANTIRPALQIIKTKPGAKVVSSIFFMCLPDQVLVYGDCAVNPDPDAETLADIAIQSADSAITFGLPARVAMISYSTGESGTGADVDKVRQATQLAQQKRPDLLLDGPLQYDAAAIADVAASKAPNSPVAGKATVFIFPDLNTGNTTYKAVQRSANVISIGPMLQGMKRPVNDLSRGALVEDILYTIALTAIQAGQE